MNLTRTISYGGSYREVWDDDYHLKIEYQHQQQLRLCFRGGAWCVSEGELPEGSLSARFFPEAADAAVAAARFLGSGRMERDLRRLSPDGKAGPIFTAEFLRILMDDFGLNLETVYPYAAPCVDDGLTEEEMEELNRLQPRSCHLFQMMRDFARYIPPVLHDIRLPDCRFPVGAVTAGEKLRLAFEARQGSVREAVLELWGDNFREEFTMKPVEQGWAVEFAAPEIPAALWYRFRIRPPG